MARVFSGARAAALTAGAWLRGGELAGVGEPGVPELETGCRLAWEEASGTRKPPMGLLGF